MGTCLRRAQISTFRALFCAAICTVSASVTFEFGVTGFAAIGFATLGFESRAPAQEVYRFFRDVREDGMGGAGVAVVDDDTALFVNPAGLGKIRGPAFTPVNPQIESNLNTISGMGTPGNFGAATTTQGLLGLATQSPNQHIHAGLEALPSFSTTNFAVAGFAKYDADVQYNPTTQKAQINYTNDDGAAIGYCFRLLSGRLKIGVSGKVDNRVYINQSVAGNSQNLSVGSLASEGDGVGWDGGILLTAPWAWLPTLGVVAHDIGNTYFTMGNGIFYHPGTIPPPQAQSVDPAFAVFPILSNTTRMAVTAEYWNVGNPDGAEPTRRLHAGAEFNFGDRLFLRGGFNEGYYTAGVEFDLGHSQFQLATYGEEIGTEPATQEDRRYVFMYGLRF